MGRLFLLLEKMILSKDYRRAIISLKPGVFWGLLLVFGFSVFGQLSLGQETNYFPSDQIFIKSQTNISHFELKYSFCLRCLSSSTGKATRFETLYLAVSEFKAPNPIMRKDFLKMLEFKKFPFIKIEFPANIISIIQSATVDTIPIKVEIRNISQSVPLAIHQSQKNDYLKVDGTATLKLSAFKIKPTLHLLGLVKVRNRLDIHILLYFSSKKKSIN